MFLFKSTRKVFVLTTLLISHVSVADQKSHWQVATDYDVLNKHVACLMSSVKKTSSDGQGTTRVQLFYNGKEFVAVTQSNIDLSYPGLGIKVDGAAILPIDHLNKETMAVFTQEADKIKQLFIEGHTAVLTLGFWPTWPKTQSYDTEFSLLGFTKAYKEFLQCQKDFQV